MIYKGDRSKYRSVRVMANIVTDRGKKTTVSLKTILAVISSNGFMNTAPVPNLSKKTHFGLP